eukprot:1406834-Rhodomonas_salina.1
MSGTFISYCLGTCIAYRPMRCPVLTSRMVLPGGGCEETRCAISLRTCYALCCTDLAYAAGCLRACYAKSGTDLARVCTSESVRVRPVPGGGRRGEVKSAMRLQACSAIFGTDMA